jgi:3',5'-cyclic AMP phosphodiesterase CpdA
VRLLAHLSDLHFGRIEQSVIEPLVSRVGEANPHLVVVSGDLTQRARRAQFREARAFLDRLPAPRLVVPGNHDVPLYDVFNRFINPLRRYRCYISEELEPFYADEEIAVAGINTARSLTFKRGRINDEQIARARAKLDSVPGHVTRVIVTHHPFDLPESIHDRELVGRSRTAMAAFAQCGADLLLAGHLHVSHSGNTAARYRMPGYSAVVVHAGTATSTRGRGEANSFNLIRIEPALIEVERLEWDAARARFESAQMQRFRKSAGEWLPA